MKLTRVELERCINLGNYEHEKIRLAVETEQTDPSVPQIVADLRKLIEKSAAPDTQALLRRQRELINEIDRLNGHLARGRADYEKARDFLVAQGIRRAEDMPLFPQFENLLPHYDNAQESVVAELVDDEDDGDHELPHDVRIG